MNFEDRILILNFIYLFIYLFKKGGRKRGEKHGSVASCTHPDWVGTQPEAQACALTESNWWPFALWDGTQPAERLVK